MKLRAALLRWYAANKRDLPWRHTRDPYAIWVSEIMLQQTRVDTVVRYYDRFLARFPTTHALAAATEDEVMSSWSGLGYYRRARLLHQGVRDVVARYDGHVPEDATQRLELAGVGRYTAGAIGSIAFDRAEPIVDGNVARVLCRLDGIDTPLGRADTERALWREAEAWAQGEQPGALNQALMELGATVCAPRAPRCASCPLRNGCVAHASDTMETLPVPRAKTAARRVDWIALLASTDDQALWLQRAEQGLFAGLWSLPMAEGRGHASAAELAHVSGFSGEPEKRCVGEVEHVLTHRHLRVQVWRLRPSHVTSHPALRCVTHDALHTLGISRLTLKLLEVARVSMRDA